jgi:hypothetical protein
MTWYASTLYRYIYKGHWEDALLPSSYFVFCTIDSPLITVVGFPPHCSSELPLQAERAPPYLRAIVSSEDLLHMIRLGFILTLIRSCLV